MYKPCFDVSTLHYADIAIEYLLRMKENGENKIFLAYLKKLNTLEGNENPNRFYDSICDYVSEINANTDSENDQGSGPASLGGQFIQFIFGLLCLSRLLEAICLGDEIYYIKKIALHEGYFRHIFVSQSWEQSARFFKPVPITKNMREQHDQWLNSSPLYTDGNIRTKLKKFVLSSLATPFISLAAMLQRASNGETYHPMTSDSFDVFDNNANHSIDDQELSDLVPITAIHRTDQDIVLLKRSAGYLINSLFYRAACQTTKTDYVINDVRLPFIASVEHCWEYSGYNADIKRILSAATWDFTDERVIDVSKVNFFTQEIRSHIIFRAVLAMCSDISEIFEGTYELRERLAPLRNMHGKTNFGPKFINDFRQFIVYTRQHEHVRFASLESDVLRFLKLPIHSEQLANLYKPIFMGRKRHLSSITTVASHYKSITSCCDQLSMLTIGNT